MFGHYAERVSVEIRRFLSSPVTGFCFDSGLCFTALTVVEVNDIKEWLSAVCVCACVCVCVCVIYLYLISGCQWIHCGGDSSFIHTALCVCCHNVSM